MKTKKLIVSGLSLLLCSVFCINTVSAHENIYDSFDSDKEEIKLSEEEINALNQYNKIFIETGFINEFELDGVSLICKDNLTEKMNEYQFNDEEQKFIKQILNYSINQNEEIHLNAQIEVKNWNIYLTNKEVKKYFGNVLTLGPIAIVGALTAIGSVGGPVGTVITFIVGSLGANYIASVVKQAYNTNKGLKIGFSGISVY